MHAIRICIRFGLSSLMGMPSTIHGFHHFFCLVPYPLQECSWHKEMYGLGSHNNGEYLQHIMWVISLNLLGWGIILFCKCISQEYFQLLLTASEQPYTLRNCPQVTFEEWQNFLLGPNFLTHKTQHKVRMKQKYSMYGSWKLIIICGAWTTVLIMITCRTPVINYINSDF